MATRPECTMRLRPRKSNTTSSETTQSRSATERQVLGDVSNRKRSCDTESTKEQIAKKPRTLLPRVANLVRRSDRSRIKGETTNSKDTSNDNNNISQRRTRSARLIEKQQKAQTLPQDLGTTTIAANEKRFASSIRTSKASDGVKKGDAMASSVQTRRSTRSSKLTTKDTKVENQGATESKLKENISDADATSNNALDDEQREDRLSQSNTSLVEKVYRMKQPAFDGKNFTRGIAEHDSHLKHDSLEVSNYVADLYQHLYLAETKSYPKMYMRNQRDINARMRAILVDWLIEVHTKFSLVHVPRNKLQLVGVTALLIACKYEEIYPPEVRDCVYITDRAYLREEVLAMEQEMLGRLSYKISVPTAYPFIQRFLALAKASPLVRAAANYYVERTLQEHDLLQFRPSVLAATAVILALNNPDISRRDIKTSSEIKNQTQIILDFTEFESQELYRCAKIVAQKVGEEPITQSRRQLITVKRKYEHRKFLSVSSTIELPQAADIASVVNADRE